MTSVGRERPSQVRQGSAHILPREKKEKRGRTISQQKKSSNQRKHTSSQKGKKEGSALICGSWNIAAGSPKGCDYLEFLSTQKREEKGKRRKKTLPIQEEPPDKAYFLYDFTSRGCDLFHRKEKGNDSARRRSVLPVTATRGRYREAAIIFRE